MVEETKIHLENVTQLYDISTYNAKTMLHNSTYHVTNPKKGNQFPIVGNQNVTIFQDFWPQM